MKKFKQIFLLLVLVCCCSLGFGQYVEMEHGMISPSDPEFFMLTPTAPMQTMLILAYT